MKKINEEIIEKKKRENEKYIGKWRNENENNNKKKMSNE